VRTGSTRLPQKALKEIGGKPTIEYLIDRVKKSKLADKIVLCTTELSEDDRLCEIATKNNIEFFRGSSPDKLKRWLGAAKQYNIDFFVNADGDDIFFDSGLADICFEQHLFNLEKTDFIDGRGLYNDVYGIKTTSLKKVCDTKSDTDTEFIRPHFVSKSAGFNVERIKNIPEIYEKKKIRMTLDYEEDLNFFKTVIEHFHSIKAEMIFENILKFLESNPSVVDINWFREQSWIDNQKKMIERVEVR
jgi:spore coat polysaccharide biosynthesis protein SpsF